MKFEEDMSRPIRDGHDKRGPCHGPRGHDSRGGQGHPPRHKIEKLPIVDDDFHLKGLITIKDIEKVVKYPNSPRTAMPPALRRRNRRY